MMRMRLPSLAENESVGHTGGLDNNKENESIDHTGVDDNAIHQITGVEDKVTGVTQQGDGEPEMDDDHPIEEEEMDRHCLWSTESQP
jgi:hypothetical protein